MKVVDLFCGAGGLSIGLAEAGLETVVGVDLDSDAMETFSAAHPGADAICDDVLTVVDGLAPRFSKPRRTSPLVLVGGPPCQGFCSINPTRHVDDPRNSCVDMFLHAAEKLSPDLVLMENVTGLLSLGKGFAKKRLQEILSGLGYKVQFMVLQAAHYGAPQNRWRLIMAASRLGPFEFPQPTHSADLKPNVAGGRDLTFSATGNLFGRLLPATTVWDAISDLPVIANGGGSKTGQYTTSPQTSYQAELRQFAGVLLNHQTQKLADLNMRRIMAIGEGENWQSLPIDLVPGNIKRSAEKWGRYTPTRFGRLRRDGFFTTILTKPEPYWGSFIHPTQDRLISVREAARAQAFPDTVEFKGGLSSQYKQVGNAVPVALGRALGRAIKDHLSGLEAHRLAASAGR